MTGLLGPILEVGIRLVALGDPAGAQIAIPIFLIVNTDQIAGLMPEVGRMLGLLLIARGGPARSSAFGNEPGFVAEVRFWLTRASRLAV